MRILEWEFAFCELFSTAKVTGGGNGKYRAEGRRNNGWRVTGNIGRVEGKIRRNGG